MVSYFYTDEQKDAILKGYEEIAIKKPETYLQLDETALIQQRLQLTYAQCVNDGFFEYYDPSGKYHEANNRNCDPNRIIQAGVCLMAYFCSEYEIGLTTSTSGKRTTSESVNGISKSYQNDTPLTVTDYTKSSSHLGEYLLLKPPIIGCYYYLGG